MHAGRPRCTSASFKETVLIIIVDDFALPPSVMIRVSLSARRAARVAAGAWKPAPQAAAATSALLQQELTKPRVVHFTAKAPSSRSCS